MRRILLCALVLSLQPVCGAYGQAANHELLKPENRLSSVSKQFLVFGGTREERSKLARRAEELKTGLLRELESRDLWRTPILLILTPEDGRRLRQPTVFLQVFNAGEAGKKIQVDIAPAALAEPAKVDTGILHALLLEWALRRQKFAGDRFIEPPGWLVAAMSVALSRRDPAELAQLYAALLETKGMPKFEKFLEQNSETLRGRARDLHAAQSMALFQSLVDEAGGRAKVVENLTLVEPSADAVERFGQTWPELVSDPQRLARVWALGVARLSSPQKVEMLSARETSDALQSAIRSLREPGDEADPARALLELGRRPDGRFLIEKAAVDLQRLGFRAHPLYAALVQEYQTMFDALGRKKRRGFAAKFTEAEDLRHALDSRSREITAFMDSRQADHEGDVKIDPDLLPQPVGQKKPARNDAVSRFLDSVEQRGW